MNCPCELYAAVDRARDKLVVQKFVERHENHNVNERLYNMYPETRKQLIDGMQDDVETKLQLGVKINVLKKHIEETTGQFIATKDLHNVRQFMRSRSSGAKSDSEMLIERLADLGSSDPDASVALQLDSSGTLEFVFFATSAMKDYFNKFPEVLMIDGTYCINKLRMPLYTFLVMDGNGHGRIAAYCFVSNERRATLEAVVRVFATTYDSARVQTVIVDKDYNEIAAVEAILPHAKLQICRFHVLQAIEREVKKTKGSPEEKASWLSIFKALVYLQDEEQFAAKEAELQAKSPPELNAYYTRCWSTCINYWAAHKLTSNVNLGNFTNNRLESHNQKIKMVLDRHMSLANAVSGLLNISESMCSKDSYISFGQCMKTAYRLGDNDSVLQDVYSACTAYAAELIRTELLEARKNTDTQAIDSCGCVVRSSVLLPCRHLFAVRMSKGEQLFCVSDVAARWLKSSSLCDARGQLKHEDSAGHLVPMSKVEKYNEALIVCKNLCDHMSFLSSKQFFEKLEQLHILQSTWLSGKHALILPHGNMSSADNSTTVNSSTAVVDNDDNTMSDQVLVTHENEEHVMTESIQLGNAGAQSISCPSNEYKQRRSRLSLARTKDPTTVSSDSTACSGIHSEQVPRLPDLFLPEKSHATPDGLNASFATFHPAETNTFASVAVDSAADNTVDANSRPALHTSLDELPAHSTVDVQSFYKSRLSLSKSKRLLTPDKSLVHASSLPFSLPEKSQLHGMSAVSYDTYKWDLADGDGCHKNASDGNTFTPSISTAATPSSKPAFSCSSTAPAAASASHVPIVISSSASDVKGAVTGALGSLTNLVLPSNPPVRGRSRVTKRGAAKRNKENVVNDVARKRLRQDVGKQEVGKQKVSKQRVHEKVGTTDKSLSSTTCISHVDLTSLRQGKMLTDVHMNAASSLMQVQFSHIEGFQDTLLGSKLQFNVCTGKFVQLLHNGSNHWICVSNIFCHDACDVHIYDSMPCSCKPNVQCTCAPKNMQVKLQVASILFLDRPRMNFIVPSFQRQAGGVDCGLFAIAAATSLCFGKNPADCLFDQASMRLHFEKCLLANHLSEFPHKPRENLLAESKRFSIRLYCSCRLPDNQAEKMAECHSCKNWFHKTCMSIPPEVFVDDGCSWLCNLCRQPSA